MPSKVRLKVGFLIESLRERMHMGEDRLKYWKHVTGIIESVMTVLALLIGGFWTYKLFVQQRLNNPHLQITQKLSHVQLSDKNNLLILDENLANVGPVLLQLKEGGNEVIKVLPLPPRPNVEGHSPNDCPMYQFDSDKSCKIWPVIEERSGLGGDREVDIEPGETDPIHREFLVPADIQVVTIVSYVRNPQRKDEFYWRSISMYDFRTGKQIPTDTQEKAESHQPTPK